jgi:hypothetical protein
MSNEQDMAVGALFRQYLMELEIKACVEISRNPHASRKDVKDARNMILLLTGAIGGFIDQYRDQIVTPQLFIQTTPYPDEAEKVRALVARFQ